MATTRKVAFPITLPAGRVGRGHLVPDLSSHQPRGFIRLPGGRRVQYGMVGFVGVDVGPEDLLERWEREVSPVENRKIALGRLQAYVVDMAGLKIGNVVEIEYSFGGIPHLRKVHDTPPGTATPLPE